MTDDFDVHKHVLPLAFYQRPDVLAIARELLGKHVFTLLDGELTGGRIVETEAYRHEGDPSLTLHLQRKARQAQALYQPGGHAYLYTVYRVHTLFNIITHDAAHPDTVLIRAIEPLAGVEVMLRRRGLATAARNLTAGPGVLSQALGLSPALNGEPLTGPRIWIEDAGEVVPDANVLASSRVGLEYAGEEAVALPWRFRLKDSKWTSPAK
ncbi:DNA-3-methyladenine glycosylase [Hymenobacter cheonanensis]|uniref:DNA-3-methyladenine glycosylase n=1 Tax=Hymenobacter sp. CA2-7 TaxID=3063993 RepID=UPI00271324C6|nr:DNA-3-methyladenine glycosylase [Hymenobacter sp. CA2-7]MDO7884476.1 DNA-3-methyladenine glycosylase [Hymenobacter sp. CA2-7]